MIKFSISRKLLADFFKVIHSTYVGDIKVSVDGLYINSSVVDSGKVYMVTVSARTDKCEGRGEFCIDSTKISDGIKHMTGKLDVEVDKDEIRIKSKKASYSCKLLAMDIKVPKMPSIDLNARFTMSTESLRFAIRACSILSEFVHIDVNKTGILFWARGDRNDSIEFSLPRTDIMMEEVVEAKSTYRIKLIEQALGSVVGDIVTLHLADDKPMLMESGNERFEVKSMIAPYVVVE